MAPSPVLRLGCIAVNLSVIRTLPSSVLLTDDCVRVASFPRAFPPPVRTHVGFWNIQRLNDGCFTFVSDGLHGLLFERAVWTFKHVHFGPAFSPSSVDA
ncbi:hypothetical protein chiPu_0006089 [Chiloscyllium punctatum]|uniref:Uncharacterized protein n=1 Tax=Chiloscyllium punctatum TaxID=137246 RepID=A0A401SBC0_CHIPU|nr:hypothetical protein [Chiloscyllium punctatum]